MVPDHSHFSRAAFSYWVARLEPWFDAAGPAGNHLLSGRRLDLTMSVGLYVGVDACDRCLYAGKVCRRDGGVAERLLWHEQPVETWSSVWLLPLSEACPDPLVRAYEASLIRRHAPSGNVQHSRSGVLQ